VAPYATSTPSYRISLELFQANVKAVQCLATEDDLADLKRVYAEYFTPDDSENEPPLNTEAFIGLEDTSKGEDLGMDDESSMSSEAIAARLGFIRNSLPHQFNRHRHRMGLTPWTNPEDFQDPSSANLQRTSLHWHQLAGVHSIIRSTFSPERNMCGHCTGMLVCDEVGLGKTALVIATIAFLNECLSSERKEHPPPILGEHVPGYDLSQFSSLPFPYTPLTRGTPVFEWQQHREPPPSDRRPRDLATPVDHRAPNAFSSKKH
jgi:hypothetical protein